MTECKWTPAEYARAAELRAKKMFWHDIDKKMGVPTGTSCNRMHRYYAAKAAAEADPPKAIMGEFPCSCCGKPFITPVDSRGIRFNFRCGPCKSTITATVFEAPHSVRIG